MRMKCQRSLFGRRETAVKMARISYAFAFIICTFQFQTAFGQDMISSNCPMWGSWYHFNGCTMPNMLASSIQQICPAAQIPGWFFCGTTDVFSYITQQCGQCAVNFQCRTRQLSYACSPSLEVERLPCSFASTNSQPCVLTSNLCSMTGFFGKKRRKRSESEETSNNATKRLFYNLNNNNGLYSSTSYPRPTLTCVQDFASGGWGGGCRCCCYPYRPVGNQCIL